jgi:hypothetical protein
MNVAQHSDDNGYWGWAKDLQTELEARKNDGGWVILLKIKRDQS